MTEKTFRAVVADEQGEVFEHPFLEMVGMNGMTPLRPDVAELIPLPEGSRLFTLPQTPPLGWNRNRGRVETIDQLPREWGGGSVQAVCAFMAPGYTRTLLPAAEWTRKRMTLPLWAYTALGWCVEEERFYVAAVKVDRNIQWQPENFDDRELEPKVRQRMAQSGGNRLLEQLSRCALDYHCFAAKNLFLGRWEAPLPISPNCNSRCIGCLSHQTEANECCPSSQERLTFVPSVEELCAVAVPHLESAENAIVSFGQGCEGDPILQAATAAKAINEMRRATSRGTVNFNTNASLPDEIDRLADAGLDSIRISLNSVREPVYKPYYSPQGYRFADVIESVHRAKQRGLFTMLNYLVFPGVTDRRDELEALIDLIGTAGVDLIQMRNLSLDPVRYWEAIAVDSEPLGMYAMLNELKQRVPEIQFGYFNRTRENFYPPGYQDDWPLGEE
ncbi:MAG: radical SAM protein [Desulfuromonas sp.]|nr:MAG: radical SAM protein [Desulfuromonas sp.]